LVSPIPSPSHPRLKETMRSVIDWRGIHNPSGHKTNLVNLAKNKRHSQKYGIALILSWS
jgi:hypothetical protein